MAALLNYLKWRGDLPMERDGFNELDSLIAYGMLSRPRLLGDAGWQVSIASATPIDLTAATADV